MVLENKLIDCILQMAHDRVMEDTKEDDVEAARLYDFVESLEPGLAEEIQKKREAYHLPIVKCVDFSLADFIRFGDFNGDIDSSNFNREDLHHLVEDYGLVYSPVYVDRWAQNSTGLNKSGYKVRTVLKPNGKYALI